ncbi:MAG: tetratricopeptide repeat protein [Fibrobacteria bacterium]|nr:tetratricopeptide repeat protein [Fibrobacteria bacterium]
MKRPRLYLSILAAALLIIILVIIWIINIQEKTAGPALALEKTAFGAAPGIKLYKGRTFRLLETEKQYASHIQKLIRKSVLRWESGEQASAITGLEEVIKLNPETVPAYIYLARFILEKNTSQDSATRNRVETLYKTALKLDPGHPGIRFAYGEHLRKNGETELAFQQYDMAVDISPTFGRPYIGLGRYHLEKEEYMQAKEYFKLAISLSAEQDFQPPYDLLAYAFYQTGHDDSAAMVVDYSKSIGINSTVQRFVEALLWEASGNLKLAKKIYTELIAESKDASEYEWALVTLGQKAPRAKLLEAVKTIDRKWEEATAAIKILDPLTHRYSDNGPLWLALGQAYFQRELYAHAITSFDSATKYDPSIKVNEFKRQAITRLKLRDTINIFNDITDTAVISEMVSDIVPEDSTTEQIAEGGITLGHYFVHWQDTPEDIQKACPSCLFTSLPNGNLLNTEYIEDVRYESFLGFKSGKLWGIFVFATDTTKGQEDLFGKLIGVNSKFSGTGRSTGFAQCAGFKAFQGVIWETEDTIEFLAQFKGKEWQARMLRADKKRVGDYKLCDLVKLVDTDNWQ